MRVGWVDRAIRSWRTRHHFYVSETREGVMQMAQRYSRTLKGFSPSAFESALASRGIAPTRNDSGFWNLVIE